MRNHSFAILLALCAGATACGGTATPAPAGQQVARDSAAPIQTDSTAYTLRDTGTAVETRIEALFTNPRAEPVYFVNCNGITSLSLQKWTDEKWVDAWSPAVPQCLSPPIVVQPGQQYRSTINVFGGRGNNHPQFSVDPIPGVYRLIGQNMLRSYDDSSYPFGEPIPAEQRVSNRFELRSATQ